MTAPTESSSSKQTKVCSLCQKEKPLSAYHRRRHYVRSGFRAACRDCTRETTREARLENPPKTDPKKDKVRADTRTAIRAGELVPKPCEVCGDERVEPHHPSYEGDDAHLIVEWLCKTHHALEHGKRPWTRQMDLFPEPTTSPDEPST